MADNILKSGARVAHIFVGKDEPSASWFSDLAAGVLNTDPSNGGVEEITSIPCNGDHKPRPDGTFGMAKVS